MYKEQIIHLIFQAAFLFENGTIKKSRILSFHFPVSLDLKYSYNRCLLIDFR